VTSDLVYVPAGGDRFRARLALEACLAEGIRAELLTADESGVDPIMGFIQGHRLLVSRGDAARVRAIVERA
jgi:hypothetical protein